MGRVILDASELVTGLWQGSLPPPGGAVRAAGFKVLVLCAREYQLQANDYPGVQVVHAPNDDHDHLPLNRDKLQIALGGAHAVATAVREGLPTLVTCAAGLNRSGLVSALSLHLLFGWPGQECVELVQRRRPSSPVHPGRPALNNKEFVAALLRLGPSIPEPEPLPSRFAKGAVLWMPR